MRLFSRLAFLSAAFALGCGNGESDGSIVARAADQSLSVQQVVALVANRPDFPADREVVRTLANLWVDYTLLASAAAHDSTMSQVDVSALVSDLEQDRLIRALRDSVIRFNPPSPGDVKARYAREAPNSFVRARQILLLWPNAATPAQKDTVRRAIAELRKELVDRKQDFAVVAKARSQDTASARNGGDIGVVTRGKLVAPLEQVVFSLKPGQISEPVESAYGMHLVKVESRSTPSFEQFRVMIVNELAAAAESSFVARVDSEYNPRVVNGAGAVLRTLANDPRSQLGRFDDTKSLLEYKNGEVTQGEALRYLQRQPPQFRNQIARSSDDSLGARVLMSLAHREMLVAEAEKRGFAIKADVHARLVAAARQNLAGAARQLGLMPQRSTDAAQIQKSVTDLLANLLTGRQREVTPLGPMSYALRTGQAASVSDAGVNAAVGRVQEMRKTAVPAGAPRE